MNETSITTQLNLPTPWQKVSTSWSETAGIELFIKRDDLIHPLISGNKWRKLQGIITSFKDFEEIITYGGAYSNHLIASAVAANFLQVSITGYVRGEGIRNKSTVIELCEYYGMKLHYLSREEYKTEKQKAGVLHHKLHIPEGGSMQEGTLACRDIMEEEWLDIDHLYLACGTGTTAAGILNSRHTKLPQMHIVSVLKGGSFLKNEIYDLCGRQDFELVLDQHRGGYAKTDKELMQFITSFYKETGILLDPIYTAKAMYALYAHVQEGRYNRTQKVGFVHTGGLTGWYGKWTELLVVNPEQV